jgi:hypothetical protein
MEGGCSTPSGVVVRGQPFASGLHPELLLLNPCSGFGSICGIGFVTGIQFSKLNRCFVSPRNESDGDYSCYIRQSRRD